MTIDEVIEIAKKANVSIRGHYDETGSTPQELLRFAQLVAVAEQEKLAAAQLQIEKLREALGLCRFDSLNMSFADMKKIGAAISTPLTPDALNEERARVAAAEREACAQLCEAQAIEWDSDAQIAEKNYAGYCADAIRARGNK